jgi:hypothetical protein
MIEFTITKQQIVRAEMLYKFNCLNNSIRQGEGNLIGAIGEIVVFDHYTKIGRNVVHAQDFNYDLLIEGFKIEVKTQENRSIPSPVYTCHVPDYNSTQECEFYCFVFIHPDMTKGWLAGHISRSKFHQIKQLKKEGEIGFSKPFKCDTWIVQVKNLTL